MQATMESFEQHLSKTYREFVERAFSGSPLTDPAQIAAFANDLTDSLAESISKHMPSGLS